MEALKILTLAATATVVYTIIAWVNIRWRSH